MVDIAGDEGGMVGKYGDLGDWLNPRKQTSRRIYVLDCFSVGLALPLHMEAKGVMI
jgi:hypothetical protein